MTHPMLRLDIDRRLKLEFHGSLSAEVGGPRLELQRQPDPKWSPDGYRQSRVREQSGECRIRLGLSA
jgi:hypothetical protein